MTATISLNQGIATLTIKTAGSLNSFDTSEFAALHAHFQDLAQDDDVRSVILTGEGRAFSAGAALNSFVTDGRIDITQDDLRDRFDTCLNPLIRLMTDFPKPLVIAINGTVAGGGMGLALSGDIVIAAESARFHCAFVRMLAIAPDLGTCWHLPNLMGRNKALPFALLGDGMTAAEASAAGLIFCTVPDEALADRAFDYAQRLAKAPAEALRHTRRLFSEASTRTMAEALDAERDVNVNLVTQPDFQEGVMAFLQGREPKFG